MGIEVAVVRVFTDAHGNFGNPLGVVDAGQVGAADRQRLATRLGYSETVFIDLPSPGATTAHARIYTPGAELPFAGHPTVGAAWWLREHGWPVTTLRVPAGIVQVSRRGGVTGVSARSEWAPELVLHQFDSPEGLLDVDPADFPSDTAHYLWAWADRAAGAVRCRGFFPNLGVPEDEATGSAALRLTDHLSRSLRIIQGRGSVLETTWNPEGWLEVAGRVVSDGVRQAD